MRQRLLTYIDECSEMGIRQNPSFWDDGDKCFMGKELVSIRHPAKKVKKVFLTMADCEGKYMGLRKNLQKNG